MVSLQKVRGFYRLDLDNVSKYYVFYRGAVYNLDRVNIDNYDSRYYFHATRVSPSLSSSSNAYRDFNFSQSDVESYIGRDSVFSISNPNGEEVVFGNIKYCDHCRSISYTADSFHSRPNGGAMCPTCFNTNSCTCADCTTRTVDYSCIEFGGEDRILCTACARNYRYCNGCGESHRTSDLQTVDSHMLCENCIHDYSVCTSCDHHYRFDQMAGDDDECICQDCSINRRNKDTAQIQAYQYKPDPIFYGETDSGRYYGIELEIDNGGRSNIAANILSNCVNGTNEYLYFKRDSSINDGFEIVSHPATLDYHLALVNWEGLMTKAVDMGYTGHDNSTCGLHVHISRQTFIGAPSTRNKRIGLLIYLFEKFRNYIVRFARRTNGSVEHFAKFMNYSKTDLDNLSLTTLYSNVCGDRYSAINLECSNTVEIRVFRSTLNYKTFVATLQFVNVMVDLANSLTHEQAKELTWENFVTTYCKQHKELYVYMTKRNLVANRSNLVAR